LVGLDGVDLLGALTDYIAGEEAGLSEAAARVAVEEVVTAIATLLEEESTVWTEEVALRLMELFWCRYLAQIILQALTKTMQDASPRGLDDQIAEIQSVVEGLLTHFLDGRAVLDVDWSGDEGTTLMRNVQSEAIAILGAGGQ